MTRAGSAWRLRMSSARLVVLYVVLVSVAVGTLLAITYLGTARALEAETDALVTVELEGLLEEFRLGGQPQLVESLEQRARGSARSGGVYLLADRDRQRIAGSLTAWPVRVRPAPGWTEFDAALSEAGRIVPQPVRARVQSLGSGGLLLVGTDLSEQRRALGRYRTATIWGVALSSLLAALLGIAYVRSVSRRVREFALTCEQIMGGDTSQRLAVDGSHSEFDVLAVAVNRMLDRIERQTETLRTTFDSTAHDLRAPLYRLRMRLEEALFQSDLADSARTTMQSALTDLDRVQRTLTTLLQIAQAEAGATRSDMTARVDLGVLLRELVDLYAPEARDRGITMAAEGADRLWTVGNRQLLAQLIANLLENTLKYVPAGGCVRCSAMADDAHVTICVADDGPGIPAADRVRVLEPFTRLERDAAQGGSGLGLSLVAAVARLHRATLRLEDNAPGLRVSCVFERSA